MTTLIGSSLRSWTFHAHSFHDWCIRGWVLIGKKNTCPSCREKVNLQQFKTNPYVRSSLARGLGLGQADGTGATGRWSAMCAGGRRQT